jgi:hypothetical protein
LAPQKVVSLPAEKYKTPQNEWLRTVKFKGVAVLNALLYTSCVKRLLTGTAYSQQENVMQVFFDQFDSVEDVLSQFSITKSDLKGCEVVFAYYTYEDYSGDALVILRDPHDGKFYEVNGGHCSCYGLEGQWEMEETTMDVMMQRSTPFFDEVVKCYIQQHLLTQEVEKVSNNAKVGTQRKI